MICTDAIRIPLTNGGFAIVDGCDEEMFRRCNWRWTRGSGYTNYVAGYHRGIVTLMHHLVLPPKLGFVPDHKDGDGLNNRRSNLRYATVSQNAQNKRKQRGKYTSRYKGVYFYKSNGRWRAHIEHLGRKMSLGYFPTEIEAAIAYNTAAQELFGEFARLNEVDHQHST